MMKSFLWVLMSCCLLTTFAKPVKVERPAQLIELFSKGSNGFINVDITLAHDIDFSYVGYKLPLGTQEDSLKCLPYTGTFNGNGYSIKNFNIIRNGDVAGLFCQLEGATIQNLVVEESCFFKGIFAGALTPSIHGSKNVTFNNIKNQANVEGYYAGGFIGVIDNGSSNNINFQNCDNSGVVTGQYAAGFIGYTFVAKGAEYRFIECNNYGTLTGKGEGSEGSVGGFIGHMIQSELITITVERSTNSGKVSGKVSGKDGNGGVIGVIEGCSGVTLSITESFVINSVSGYDNVGGFIGLIIESYAITLDIHHSNVTGMTSGHNNVGGFVGNITNNYQVNVNVNMSNSTGIVKGEQYVSGLFGVIKSSSPSKQTVVTITNSRRENSVIGTTLASCGFACVDEDSTYAVKVYAYNSISHGNVQGKKAYGIANHITEVTNIVNTGSVSGTSLSYSLWKSPIANQHSYALGSSCKGCGTATKFIKNDKDGEYYVIGTQMKISDMLNFVVNQDHHWKILSFWTKDLGFDVKKEGQLSLAHSFTISFSALFLVFFLMVQGIFTQ